MIVVDSSAFITYFAGIQNSTSDKIEALLETNNVALSPIVLVEILSEPNLPNELMDNLLALPMLEPQPGYWVRAGKTRAKILAKKFKARLADTLIAQICIDYNLPLLTLDKDFKHFARFCGLKLI